MNRVAFTGKYGTRPFFGGSGRRAIAHTRPAFPKNPYGPVGIPLIRGASGVKAWGSPPDAEGIPKAPRHTRPDPCLDNTAGQSATQHLERSSPKSICHQNDLNHGWSSQPKPDEVKMVLYIVKECEMPCFSLAVTEGQMSIRTAKSGHIIIYLL